MTNVKSLGKNMKSSLIAIGIIGWAALSTNAENWPVWRGPRGDGTSLETKVPTKWSATNNIHWKTELPGIGHASPVVFGS